tara:strand:+ start:40274 stop:42214 length:1941 start_codon:yes stop_codon:yes gene_type:complete
MLSFLMYPSSLGYNNGMIRVPDAILFSEGYVSFNYSNYDPYVHYTFSAAPFNWLEASFFYVDINTYRYPGSKTQSAKDKGFSVKVKLKDQEVLPAIAVGFNDFGGTGLFSSEYIVASYFKERFDLSLGIGWGLMGGINNFSNPFLSISDEFRQRRVFSNKIGGTPDLNTYFKGSASLFGGLRYYPTSNKKLALMVEYDSHNFTRQYGYLDVESSRINLGINYVLNKNIELGYHLVEGNNISFNVNLKKDFSEIKARSINFNLKPDATKEDSYTYLLNRLQENSILLQKASIDTETAEAKIKFIQLNSNNERLAAIDVASEIQDTLDIDTQYLIPANGSIDYATYIFEKGVLVNRDKSKNHTNEEYEFNPIINYPVNNVYLTPGFKSHIGSPAGFVFGEVFMALNYDSILRYGVEFESMYTVSLFDNYKELNYYPGYTSIEPVRIEIQDYLKEGKNGFEIFQISKIGSIHNNQHYILTFGHLEQMFSGVHFEYLYETRFPYVKVGFEISDVIRRDYDKSFDGFKNYNTLTGHAYLNLYEPLFDIELTLSYGKYLAKDVGYTLNASKVFQSGLELGAFFTRTNLSFEEFGEGSFDKGVYLKYPLNLFDSQKFKGRRQFGYRPITRDGGAKLNVSKRLLDITHDAGKIH